ncbi:MAG: InlB B-repeat-containing protein, partial [Kiritimatiellaeota bacterium]|nr:InlB B-repeat-containing protein [Kiritimatiellota bacterium]
MKRLITTAVLGLTLAGSIHAADINVSGGGIALQDAIDSADPGDVLLVAPDTYSPINTGGKVITIIATDPDPAATVIDGGGTERCATLALTAAPGWWTNETGTVLSGFTLRDGLDDYGGGVYGGTLTNCVLTDNAAVWYGGGAFRSVLQDCHLQDNTADFGGGAYECALSDGCILDFNTAHFDGGGAWGGTLSGCLVSDNKAIGGNGGGVWGAALDGCELSDNTAGGSGGGAYDGTLANCVLTGNTADDSGGGAWGGTLEKCDVSWNVAVTNGGGVCNSTLTHCGLWENAAENGGGAYGGTLKNCVVTDNAADGDGGGTRGATLVNCTVSRNTAANGGGVYGGLIRNTIVLDNFVGGEYAGAPTFNNSCSSMAGSGVLVAFWGDVFQSGLILKKGSPCIDAGSNAFVDWDFDFAGNPRIIGGTVDMGAYEHHSFEVTFINDLDTPATTNIIEQTHGFEYDLPAAPSWTGYTFAGWYSDATGWVTNGTVVMLTTNHTLYAQRTADEYDVTFDANGGLFEDSTATTNITQTFGAAYILPAPPPVMTGHTFADWWSAATDLVPPGTAVTVDADHTLFALWTPNDYTVWFDGNGSDGGVMTDQDFIYGVPQALKPNAFTKTGYTFTGWLDESANPYGDEEVVSDLTSEPGGAVRLIAQWAANDYTVAFDGNGADGGVMADQPFVYDVEQALTDNDFTKAGYSFAGWAANGVADVVVFTNGQVVCNLTAEPGAVVALEAVWTNNLYVVTFDTDPDGVFEGGHTVTNITQTFDEKYVLPPDPEERVGYTFEGWFDTGGPYTTNTTVSWPGDHTLYARWAANVYTVTFDGNGGVPATQDIPQTFGDVYDLPPDPTRAGYDFVGWFDAPTGGYHVTDTTEVTYPADHTLWAQWTAHTYTVVYDGNGEDGGTTAPSHHTYDVPSPLTPNGFYKDGYVLTGWTSAGGDFFDDEETVVNLTDVDGDTVTLYAQWDDPANPWYVDETRPDNSGDGKT